MLRKVFVILVNFKNFLDTIECIESLLKSTYENFQIIIVDNSSDDTSNVMLQNWFNSENFAIETRLPKIVGTPKNYKLSYRLFDEDTLKNSRNVFVEKVLLVKAENRGFAAANNVALKYISNISNPNNLVWVLNNDTVVEKNCMSYLVDNISNNSRKIILGSKLRYYHEPHKIQAIGGKFNKLIASTKHIGEGEIDRGQYDSFKFGEYDYVVGASMFFKVRLLNEVGFMNEEYFLYFEELDLGLSGKNKGYEFDIEPRAIVYHKEGASIRKVENKMSVSDYYSIINRMKFTIRWYKTNIMLVFASVLFAILKRLFKGQFKLVKKIIYGLRTVK